MLDIFLDARTSENCAQADHIPCSPLPHAVFKNWGVWVFWAWAACSHFAPAINPVLRPQLPHNLVSIDWLYCARVSRPKTGSVTHLPTTSTKVEAKSNNVCEILCCNFSDIKPSWRSDTALATLPFCINSWPVAPIISTPSLPGPGWVPCSYRWSFQYNGHSLSSCNSFPHSTSGLPQTPTNWLHNRTHQKSRVLLIPASCCLIMTFSCLVV